MEKREYGFEEDFGAAPKIDARTAVWILSAQPRAAGRHLHRGVPLPAPEKRPPGTGDDWRERAAAEVLRECFRRKTLAAELESVEVAALNVLPEPDESPSTFGRPSVHERCERAVSEVAGEVVGILRHGPSAGFVPGEVVSCSAELRAEVCGMLLGQRVDLLWRNFSGGLEAVLVDEEPNDGGPPAPPSEDWGCILAAAVVSVLYGATPRLHVVRVSAEVAQTATLSRRTLKEKLGELQAAVAEALEPGSALHLGRSLYLPALGPLLQGALPRGLARPGTFSRKVPLAGPRRGREAFANM